MIIIRIIYKSAYVKALLLLTVIAANLIYVGVKFGLSKSDWSGWVQAVGSIAAIFFAYFFGERQARAALDSVREAERLTSVRTYDQILALGDSAQKFTEQMSRIFREGGFNFIELKINYDDSITESLLDSLKAVPAHELGSYNAILALATLRKALYDFRSNMTRVHQYVATQTNHDTGAITHPLVWNPIPIQLCVQQITRCVEALRKYRPDFAKTGPANSDSL